EHLAHAVEHDDLVVDRVAHHRQLRCEHGHVEFALHGGDDAYGDQRVVHFAGERGDGETLFEAQAEIDHDADDHHDYRDDAAVAQFRADLRTDEIRWPRQRDVGTPGLQRLEHVRGHAVWLDHAAHDRCRIGLGLQADRDVARAAQALHHRVLESG